jgi:hypothetical protein
MSEGQEVTDEARDMEEEGVGRMSLAGAATERAECFGGNALIFFGIALP